MALPLTMDVVTPLLVLFRHCPRCEAIMYRAEGDVFAQVYEQTLADYPEAWKAALAHLSQWLRAFRAHYGPYVRVRVLDAHSPWGLWKVLRHRLRPLPGFVTDAGGRFRGWQDEPALHQHLYHVLSARGLPQPGASPPSRLLPQAPFELVLTRR